MNTLLSTSSDFFEREHREECVIGSQKEPQQERDKNTMTAKYTPHTWGCLSFSN